MEMPKVDVVIVATPSLTLMIAGVAAMASLGGPTIRL
jgi:hypothetical protein